MPIEFDAGKIRFALLGFYLAIDPSLNPFSHLIQRSMFSQFQPYLESIRATYEKWCRFYTPTDAAGKERQAKQAAPTFDFGLMVQTVKKEERREEEKIERFPVLEGIRKYAEQHVLLVGRPGSGKSTALARLMLEEATIASSRLPVLVELRYWQGSIEQLIRDSLMRHEMPAELFEEALKRSLLLFDGVNELPSEEARSQLSAFRRNHPKLPMIFTTRDLSIGGDLGIEQKLEMQPLTEAQMQTFIRAYVPEQAEAMLRQLKDRLREFGQTPLLLWMLCGVFQQTGTIPENLGLVFREFTQGYERYLKDDVRIESDRAWWKPVLQQLAWVMMQGEKPTEFRVAIRKEEAVRAIAQFLDGKVQYAEDFARKCLRDLQKYHLIQVGTNREELEFRHQLIQEFYAAEALLEQLRDLTGDKLKQNYFNYLKWTEPLALMLATVEDEALAIRVVEWALGVDRTLGARLAGEVKSEFQARTVKFVDALEVPTWLKIMFLGETRSDIATNTLLKRLEDSNSNVRMIAAEALGKIGTGQAVEGLLKQLEDSNPDVCWSAKSELGKIGTEQAVEGLLKRLEDSNSKVRRSAASALGKIGTEQAVKGLLKRLEHSDSDVCWSAASALGAIGTEQAVEGLLKRLEDSNSNVRMIAAEALGKIGTEQVVEGLLKRLEDSNSNVRMIAAEALGKIGTERALESLLKQLEDSNSDVCWSATAALGAIGTEQAVESLLERLEDSNPPVRGKAAAALGAIGTEQAVEGLLKRLEDSHFLVRVSAASALGAIGTEQAVESLLERLEDSSSDVRVSAAEALGKVAKKHADTIAPHLPHLLALIPTEAGQAAHRAILAIQENCKYYNYEIYQDYLESQKADRQTPQNNDLSPTTIYNIGSVGNLNPGTVHIEGDQIGEQHNHP